MPAVDVSSVPVVSGKETAQAVAVLEDLIKNLNISTSADEVHAATGNLATYFSGPIPEQTLPLKAVEVFQKQLNNKKDATARERACEAIRAIASHQTIAPGVEPHLVSLLGPVLAASGDKMTAVQKAAQSAALAIVQAINANAVKAVVPVILNSLQNAQKWQEKMCALDCLNCLVESAPAQLSFRVPDLIPAVSEAMWDTKADIKKAAYSTMEKVCGLIVNKDIERFIPELIKCIAKPENVPETVHLLGATTFVSDVTGPTLAIMVPLLDRGLVERETAIKRKSAVIVDNMCKLVEDPQIVAPFLPKLMPRLEKNYETLADPEAREKTKQALDTLIRVGDVKDGKIPEISTAGDVETVAAILKDILSPKYKAQIEKSEAIINYVGAIAGQLVDEKDAEVTSWTQNALPYITAIIGEEEAKAIAETLRKRASPGAAEEDAVLSDEEEGEDLCNCTFSLAYGAKILLNQTSLRLKRGQRYGLLGPNGTGKTTLMRAINNEQLEGFPKKDEVKTVYVEHDLDAADTEQTVIGWTMKKLRDVGIDIPQSDVEAKLEEFGFLREQFENPITSLSGGWKMKLALARAVFENPDILLLDEPTNHLDVKNVAWLENYLCNSPCTSIIVSHDSKFLDNVIQHVVHYERFKLKRYRGNLSEFVKKVPSARSYYELSASDMEFKFPEPGFLEGVKTKAKAIIRVSNMSFQYPGTPKPQLTDITFQVSLGSRIAVIGPNGAGKSTLVNVLTGELIPTSGEVYQHENIRIAYIKQHAFAHIDNHLDKTPSEYIQWRFQTGEDRETMDRANKIVTEDDEKAMDKIYKIDGTLRRVIGIHARRKFKNSYEYECSFALGENVGMKSEKWTPMPTNYLDRDSLGALSKALKTFEGGVVIITHSREFTENLTEEVWAVMDGKMTPSGHNWVQGQGSGPRLEDKEGPTEVTDAFGNKSVVEKKKKLSSAEMRKKRKERLARKKRGEEVFSDEDDI
ncbi:hypothetical protein KXV48_001639 [Aspergillus fumigatus]|nr:hypothetical protein KXV48_001639 [Aspergillus fumigatus]